MGKQMMLNGFLFVVFIFFLWINTLQRDFSKPNLDILPDMAQTRAYAAYSENPSFANGQTIQLPAPGTIARGHELLYFDATEEEALRAGLELTNPVAPGDKNALKRGELVYTTFCTPCHGGTGLGDGLVSMRGFPPPPSLLTGDSVKWKDGHLFHIITYGGKNMSSYAYQVDVDDRWKVVNFIRALQAEAQEQAAAGLPAEASNGEADATTGTPTQQAAEKIPVIVVLTDEGLELEDAPVEFDADGQPIGMPSANDKQDEDAS